VQDIELEFWTSIYFEKIKNGAKPEDIAATDLATLDFDPEKSAQAEIDRIDDEDDEDDPKDFEVVFDDRI
jgi:hypothetical protein